MLGAGKGRVWGVWREDVGKRWLGSKLGARKEAGTQLWVGGWLK